MRIGIKSLGILTVAVLALLMSSCDDGGNGGADRSDINYTATANNNTSTTAINLTFASTVTGLTVGDVSVTNGTGTVTKGGLTGSGTSWAIGVTVTTAGNVTVSINKAGIENGNKTVAVAKLAPVAPSAPIGVTAEATLSSSITVKWSSILNVNNFKIYRSTSPSGTFSYLTETSSTQYIDTKVSSNTTYYYKIIAVNNGLESKESVTASATTSPNTPTGVTATATTTTITVKWDTVPGASMYIVYAWAAGTFYVNTNQFTRNYEGVIVGDYFTVSACNINTGLESARSIQVFARLIGK